ncbi:MAG: hypothetical protein WA063_04255 [Minisyncoccia bacterium]
MEVPIDTNPEEINKLEKIKELEKEKKELEAEKKELEQKKRVLQKLKKGGDKYEKATIKTRLKEISDRIKAISAVLPKPERTDVSPDVVTSEPKIEKSTEIPQNEEKIIAKAQETVTDFHNEGDQGLAKINKAGATAEDTAEAEDSVQALRTEAEAGEKELTDSVGADITRKNEHFDNFRSLFAEGNHSDAINEIMRTAGLNPKFLRNYDYRVEPNENNESVEIVFTERNKTDRTFSISIDFKNEKIEMELSGINSKMSSLYENISRTEMEGLDDSQIEEVEKIKQIVEREKSKKADYSVEYMSGMGNLVNETVKKEDGFKPAEDSQENKGTKENQEKEIRNKIEVIFTDIKEVENITRREDLINLIDSKLSDIAKTINEVSESMGIKDDEDQKKKLFGPIIDFDQISRVCSEIKDHLDEKNDNFDECKQLISKVMPEFIKDYLATAEKKAEDLIEDDESQDADAENWKTLKNTIDLLHDSLLESNIEKISKGVAIDAGSLFAAEIIELENSELSPSFIKILTDSGLDADNIGNQKKTAEALIEMYNKTKEDIRTVIDENSKDTNADNWKRLQDHYSAIGKEFEDIMNDNVTPDKGKNEILESLKARLKTLDSSVLENYLLEKNTENEKRAFEIQAAVFSAIVEKFKDRSFGRSESKPKENEKTYIKVAPEDFKKLLIFTEKGTDADKLDTALEAMLAAGAGNNILAKHSKDEIKNWDYDVAIINANSVKINIHDSNGDEITVNVDFKTDSQEISMEATEQIKAKNGSQEIPIIKDDEDIKKMDERQLTQEISIVNEYLKNIVNDGGTQNDEFIQFNVYLSSLMNMLEKISKKPKIEIVSRETRENLEAISMAEAIKLARERSEVIDRYMEDSGFNMVLEKDAETLNDVEISKEVIVAKEKVGKGEKLTTADFRALQRRLENAAITTTTNAVADTAKMTLLHAYGKYPTQMEMLKERAAYLHDINESLRATIQSLDAAEKYRKMEKDERSLLSKIGRAFGGGGGKEKKKESVNAYYKLDKSELDNLKAAKNIEEMKPLFEGIKADVAFLKTRSEVGAKTIETIAKIDEATRTLSGLNINDRKKEMDSLKKNIDKISDHDIDDGLKEFYKSMLDKIHKFSPDNADAVPDNSENKPQSEDNQDTKKRRGLIDKILGRNKEAGHENEMQGEGDDKNDLVIVRPSGELARHKKGDPVTNGKLAKISKRDRDEILKKIDELAGKEKLESEKEKTEENNKNKPKSKILDRILGKTPEKIKEKNIKSKQKEIEKMRNELGEKSFQYAEDSQMHIDLYGKTDSDKLKDLEKRIEDNQKIILDLGSSIKKVRQEIKSLNNEGIGDSQKTQEGSRDDLKSDMQNYIKSKFKPAEIERLLSETKTAMSKDNDIIDFWGLFMKHRNSIRKLKDLGRFVAESGDEKLAVSDFVEIIENASN